MQQPKTPEDYKGFIVRSNRDPDRIGLIESIETDGGDRALIRWQDAAIEIPVEWSHVELLDFMPPNTAKSRRVT